MQTFYTISEMAVRCGLSEYTLRYYEKAGLIRAVARDASGHRQYSPLDQGWIDFLLRLRTTGMPVAQMQQFAALREQGEATVPQRRALLQAHLVRVRERVRELQQCEQVLVDKVDYYGALEAGMTSPINTTGDAHERTLRKRLGKTQ